MWFLERRSRPAAQCHAGFGTKAGVRDIRHEEHAGRFHGGQRPIGVRRRWGQCCWRRETSRGNNHRCEDKTRGKTPLLLESLLLRLEQPLTNRSLTTLRGALPKGSTKGGAHSCSRDSYFCCSRHRPIELRPRRKKRCMKERSREGKDSFLYKLLQQTAIRIRVMVFRVFLVTGRGETAVPLKVGPVRGQPDQARKGWREGFIPQR